ncbi:hypothetical protein GCM10027187_31230 [Streptosporangium sandarakinum]
MVSHRPGQLVLHDDGLRGVRTVGHDVADLLEPNGQGGPAPLGEGGELPASLDAARVAGRGERGLDDGVLGE